MSLKPSYSTFPKAIRSPNKTRNIYDSALSLKSIIGTTVSSPIEFDSLPSARIYAYVAGASAVVVQVSNHGQYSQTFFRARPTAVPTSAVITRSGIPSTPSNVSYESRSRASRESSTGYSPATPNYNDSSDSQLASKTWTSRERIKAATCLSISRDGNFLAVGETGYSPRVLIFCLQRASSESPLSILSEHTYGVRAVAFSADTKYLASLGTLNDGFLHVWTMNTRNGVARLHSSNKCTNVIKGMVWMGTNIITVGTRHVKVWRVIDGGLSPVKHKFGLDGAPITSAPLQGNPKTLSGRNCLLGPLLEMTFTCVAAISEDKAILCTDRGDICLLVDNEKQRLSRIGHLGFGATCCAVDMIYGRIRIGGRNGRIKTLDLDEILNRSALPSPSLPPEDLTCYPTPSNSPGPTGYGHLHAMAILGDGEIVSVNSKHAIEISTPSDEDTVLIPKASPFTAHSENVQGVKLLSQPNQKGAAFFTWSTCGAMLFWDLQGRRKGSMQVELEQDDNVSNQCRVVRASKNADFFVSGDKYGVLRIIDGSSQTLKFCTKAHGSEIQDIDILEGETSTLVASCGRDRTVQLFKMVGTSWVLVQTMDEHTASVSCVSFCENGEKLISTSTDRTIQVRVLATKQIDGKTLTAAIPVRVIHLKASPVSMTISSNGQTTSLTVSLLDRSVATYDVGSGRLTNSFRAVDNETCDAVVMDALVMGKPSSGPSRPTFLAGVSSTDKSVRVYEGTTGFFLDREWGHTASVTDVALLEDDQQTTLISTGSDGTIMIWSLSARTPDSDTCESPIPTDDDSPIRKEAITQKQPIRKVMSKAELAEFQRSSPNATPTHKSSGPPPRTLRKKTSKYGLSSQPSTLPAVPPIPYNQASFTGRASRARTSVRDRSRSSSRSPRPRRPSAHSLAESRKRTKSASQLGECGGGGGGGGGSLNASSEQVCRTLRGYRKKLKGSELLRDEAIREVEAELRLTAKALGEKTLKAKSISETTMTDLLDQYSSRLVSIFDEKLRLGLGGGGGGGGGADGAEYGVVGRRVSGENNGVRMGAATD